MKEYNLLVWLTQLGLSVAMPLGGFTLLGLWLRNRFSLGAWVMILGCIAGFACAVNGLRHTMSLMERMEKNMKDYAGKKEEPPPVSFNDHE